MCTKVFPRLRIYKRVIHMLTAIIRTSLRSKSVELLMTS